MGLVHGVGSSDPGAKSARKRLTVQSRKKYLEGGASDDHISDGRSKAGVWWRRLTLVRMCEWPPLLHRFVRRGHATSVMSGVPRSDWWLGPSLGRPKPTRRWTLSHSRSPRSAGCSPHWVCASTLILLVSLASLNSQGTTGMRSRLLRVGSERVRLRSAASA